MLATIRTPAPSSVRPEIRSVSFSAATIRTGRVTVAKIDCSGIKPREIRCEAASPGFELELLPHRTRQGRFVIMGIRIHRSLGTPRTLCLVRFSAAGLSTSASVTVLA